MNLRRSISAFATLSCLIGLRSLSPAFAVTPVQPDSTVKVQGSVTMTNTEKAEEDAVIAANVEKVQLTADSEIGKQLDLPVCKWALPDSTPKAVILIMHGATLYSGAFDSVARHFAAEGYAVYGDDMRGFGRWRTEQAKFNGDGKIHYTDTKHDLVHVLEALNKEYPNTPVFCMGESVGANLALLMAADHSELCKGAIMSSPCIKRQSHPNHRYPFDFFTSLNNPYTPLDMTLYIKPYLSEDKRITKYYFTNPNMFYKLSCADMMKTVRTNEWALLEASHVPDEMPCLIVAGKKDKVYPVNGVKQLERTIGSKKLTVHVEPKKGHILLESPYWDHSTVEVIDNWLTSNLKTTQISQKTSRYPQ